MRPHLKIRAEHLDTQVYLFSDFKVLYWSASCK